MPPKAKVKNAPNQHDKRHESGLAAPGRRISKQRSSGQLNGQAQGKPATAASPPPALPSSGLNQGFRFSRTSDTATAIDRQLPSISVKEDHAALHEASARDRTPSDASEEGRGGGSAAEGIAGADMADTERYAVPGSTHHQAEPSGVASAPGYGSALSKSQLVPSGGLAPGVSTILAYYPLRDAISILIILLSLPPTLVLLIQTLFTSLTFVPPTAGLSFSSLPNLKEIFNGPNLGYPALATILIVDLIVWVCWLPVWKPLQHIFLDFSQAVIAISLSGAASSTGGPTYSIATCTLLVCLIHVLRYKAIHLTAFDYLRSIFYKVDVAVQFDVPSFASAFFSSSTDRGWMFTVVRTMLGIHIVSQGITTCIRRSLVKANERDQNLPSSSKTDPEAASTNDSVTRHSVDALQATHNLASSEGRQLPSSVPRDAKSRESNSKKKKKQANQARSQQPLWAAIASTKVTFVKELEQRDAAGDARDATAMYANDTNSVGGSASAYVDRIWISDIHATDVQFGLDLSAESARESSDRLRAGISLASGIDKSKPFYVRINGANWSSTRIMSSATGEQSSSKDGGWFDGEIFGLAPLSKYLCEIVGIASGRVLCSTSLITQATPTAEQANSTPIAPQHPALRPSSPITTLKQSILTAEAKLNETRNRTRKSKKDQRGVHSDIRREINLLRSKLESSGGIDDKQERRLMQINQHKTQAEEATAELKQQIDAFGEIPDKEMAESEALKQTWQAALNTKNAARRDLEAAKAELDRELTNLRTELAAAESKREKLTARHTQRAQELEKALAKQKADMTAKQKREYERSQLMQSRQEEESSFHFHVRNMEADTMLLQSKTQEAYHQIAALNSWATQAPSAYPGYSSPPTPESVLASAVGPGASQSGFAGFQLSSFSSTFQPSQSSATVTAPGPRGRSSSMLSQYSGFTDGGAEVDDEEEVNQKIPSPPLPQFAPRFGRKVSIVGGMAVDGHSNSDGSETNTNVSTGSSSPRPEAKSFVPAARMNPIGPPSKAKGESRNLDSPRQSPGMIGSDR